MCKYKKVEYKMVDKDEHDKEEYEVVYDSITALSVSTASKMLLFLVFFILNIIRCSHKKDNMLEK